MIRGIILFILFAINFGSSVIILGDIPIAVTGGDVKIIAIISLIILFVLFLNSNQGKYKIPFIISLFFLIISIGYTLGTVKAIQTIGTESSNYLAINILGITTSCISLVFSFYKTRKRL